MKYALSILAALALPMLALAADPYIKTKVDGDRPRQPWSIDTRQGDTPTARIYTYIGGKKWVADTNWIPVLGWGTNGQYSTGLHSITGNADGVNNYAKFNIPVALTGTSGTFYASFSMTNRVNARRFTWPDGRFLLDRNPASGGNALAAISNILDFSQLTVLNRPYLIPAETNGWNVTGGGGDAFTNWVAVSGSRLTLAGAGRSGSNTIGLTDAAIQGAATGAVHGSYLHVNSTAAWVIASITNALNDSVVALNAASNTFEADINALVAASNRPSLTQVSDVGNTHGDGTRGVELVAGGPDYALMASNGTIRVRLADGGNAAAGYFRGSAGTDIITIGDSAGGSTFSNSAGYVDLLKNSIGIANRVGTSAGIFQLGNGVGQTAILATNTGGRIALGTSTNPLTILAGDGLPFLPGGIDFGNAEAFAAKYTSSSLVDGHVLTWDSGKSTWTNEPAPGAAGGEINTLSSVGTGSNIVFGKDSTNLQTRTLSAGSGISLSTDELGSNIVFTADLASADTNEFLTRSGTHTVEGSITWSNHIIFALDNFVDIGSDNFAAATTHTHYAFIYDKLNVLGEADVTHTSAVPGEHAMEIDMFAQGIGDSRALEIRYETGAQVQTVDEAVILVSIDETASLGGDVFAKEILTTEGSADVYAIKTGPNVNPFVQQSGDFQAMDFAQTNGADGGVLIAFTSTVTSTEVFLADNDTITVGKTNANFEDIEVILVTNASGSGITPQFHYSSNVTSFAQFFPTDGTDGFKGTGIISWEDENVPGWSTNINGHKVVRITRTKNSLSTTPVVEKLLIAAVSEYKWLKSGDANFNTLTANVMTNAGSPVLTAANTNGWDVSGGGGGGLPAWVTNYSFAAVYASNDYQTLTTSVTNILEFAGEIYDYGNMYDPTTSLCTIRRDGKYSVRVDWVMGHAFAASAQSFLFVQTNSFGVGSAFQQEGSTGNSQEVGKRSFSAPMALTSGTTVRATFWHNHGADRVGGGDDDGGRVNSTDLRLRLN